MPDSARISLIGLDPAAMAAALAAAGVAEKFAKMRVRQLWNWIYVHGARDFAQMSNLAKEFRADMAAHFTLARPETIRSSTPAARFSKEPPFARLCGHQAEFHSAWFGRLQRLQEGERSRRVRTPVPAGGLAGA